MKRIYTKPEIKVTAISSQDVITLSSATTQTDFKRVAKSQFTSVTF